MADLASHSYREGQSTLTPASLMSVNPSLLGRRPSIFEAIEVYICHSLLNLTKKKKNTFLSFPSFFYQFRDVVNSLKLDSSARALGVLGRSYPSDLYNSRQRSRTLPYSRSFNHSRRRSWASVGGIMDEGPSSSHHYSPTYEQQSNPNKGPAIVTDTLQVPSPSTPDHRFQFSTSPLSISPQEENNPSSSRFLLDDSSLISSPMSSPSRSPILSPLLLPTATSTPIPFKLSLLNKIQTTFFPYLTGFSQKSLLAKLTVLIACPATLLLTLTLPVVDMEDILSNGNEKDKKDDARDDQPSPLPPPTIVIEDTENEVIIPEENEKSFGWNRTLTAIQFFFAPLFASIVLFGKSHLSKS